MGLKLKPNCSWAIAYINRDFMDRVEKDLSKFPDKYREVKAYIPTVKILKKQFKGKDIFEEVPLLFNYGFFQLPNRKLESEFLQEMKKDIPAIYAWVKDTKSIITSRPSLIEGNEPLIRKDMIPVALATSGEIRRLVDAQKEYNLYSKDDIDNLQPGMMIILKGYPFEGMTADVIKVNSRKQEVEVELQLEGILKKIAVSFDNVFYTIYMGTFDEKDFKEKSLEDIKIKGKNSAQNYLRYDD
jgi:transcription antitermination factor NusG